VRYYFQRLEECIWTGRELLRQLAGVLWEAIASNKQIHEHVVLDGRNTRNAHGKRLDVGSLFERVGATVEKHSTSFTLTVIL
jgi:hypothetical protein